MYKKGKKKKAIRAAESGWGPAKLEFLACLWPSYKSSPWKRHFPAGLRFRVKNFSIYRLPSCNLIFSFTLIHLTFSFVLQSLDTSAYKNLMEFPSIWSDFISCLTLIQFLLYYYKFFITNSLYFFIFMLFICAKNN